MLNSKCKNLSLYSAWLIIGGLLAYTLYFFIWTIFNTETGNGDNVEHIHSTWLVANGKVPYRDFFQHHNPLLWYTFAPFIGYFSKAIDVLDAAHAASIGAALLTFFVIYKICIRFFASPVSALTAIIILCPPYYSLFCFNYNPDTFMALFFAVGIYYLFMYLEKKKQLFICLSFLAFFISFLYTQKVLVILFFLGCISLFVFYKQKTPLQDILYALILPCLGLLLFVALLYNAGALALYWKSNYPFNIIMQKYYGFNQINVMDYKMAEFAVILAIISIAFCLYRANIYFKIVAILFAIELPLRCCYFSIAPYYLLPLMIFCCCLNSVLIEKIINKCFYMLFLFLAVGIYYAHISLPHYLASRGQDRSFARYLTNAVTPCDYVLCGYLGNQSIMNKDPHYYWAMLGHIDMAGEEAGIKEHPNVNELVLKYKPKFIYGGGYWSSFDQNRGKSVFIQQVSPDIINEYYLPAPFADFYVLKYEYRGKNCQYDEKLGEWHYAD